MPRLKISPCSLLLGAETRVLRQGGDPERQVHTRMAECRIKDQKLNATSLLKLVFLKKAQRAGAGSSSLVMLLEDETAGGFPMIHAAGHLSPSVSPSVHIYVPSSMHIKAFHYFYSVCLRLCPPPSLDPNS